MSTKPGSRSELHENSTGSYDVAVVGGGPAGALCAARLASTGVRVALIDPGHPREKPCGGGVTARALALIGGDADPQGAGVPITGATLTFGARAATVPLVVPHVQPRLRVFSRAAFDAALADRARAAGATIVADRVADVARTGGGWRLSCRRSRIDAEWLIGADGANSLVRKRVSRPFGRGDLSIGCGYYVHGVSAAQIDIGFEPQPAGYLWSFPRPDHLAVGVCAQADESSVATLMPVVDRWIREHVPEAASLTRYSWPIPSLTVRALERERPAGDRWMLLGDAAGLVDPITREGIYFALQSAEYAAASLCTAEPSARYAADLRDSVHAELLTAARLKARFYRPPFIALLIRALQRSARIRAVMADLVAGDQPYHSLKRRLLSTLELRLMAELFYRT